MVANVKISGKPATSQKETLSSQGAKWPLKYRAKFNKKASRNIKNSSEFKNTVKETRPMAARKRPIDDFIWSVLVLGALVIAALFVMWPRETRVDLRKSPVKNTESTHKSQHAAAPAPKAESATQHAATASQPQTPAPTGHEAPQAPKAEGTPRTTAQQTAGAPTTTATTAPNAVEQKDTLDRAMKAVDEGKWQEAEALFKSVLQADPQNEAALTEMAMIHLIDKKDPEGAMPYIHDALEANPQNETMMTEYVNAAKLTGKLPEAIDYLQSLEGKGGQVDLGIARAYQAMGDSEKSIPYFEKTVREGTSGVPSEETLEDLSDAYVRSGNIAKGSEALQSAIQSAEQRAAQHNADPAARENLSFLKIKQATLLWDNGDTTKAKAIVQELERTDPNNELLIALKKDMEQRGQATAP